MEQPMLGILACALFTALVQSSAATAGIAIASTLLNIINTLVFIGFATWFTRLAKYLGPDRKSTRVPAIEPEFLNDTTA